MTRLPKSVLSFGAVALAACVLTLAVPRSAHAVAAALVQVVNTRSTPVPNQDVDHPARHPFTASCNVPGAFAPQGYVVCYPSPAPPAGFETVVQSVNILVNRNTGSGSPSLTELNFTAGGNFYEQFLPFVPQGIFNQNWVVQQAVTNYVDPGGSLQCLALLSDTTTNVQLNCTVSGYTVALP
jgi:hypothetical protein